MTTITEIKNAIVTEMAEELDERNYEFENRHLEKIVDTWFERKSGLIDLLSKHPLWNPEKFMIQFDTDMERRICTGEIGTFTYWLRGKIDGFSYWEKDVQSKECLVCNFINNINKQFFDEDMKEQIDKVNALNENYKLRTNMKASKAIGKICREEGWDKLDGFNQKYAALCDCLNPLKITRHTVISLNPVDFLLMSNGNSWESCHYIGNEAYDAGCYSSGTISYMLDEHSFIFYTVDASYNGNHIERERKIQRQVFGYNDEVLAQLRLYPQNNDSGAEMIYESIRAIVQKVISDCLGKPNMWIKSTKDISDVISRGCGATCFPDWRSGNPGADHCSLSTHKERENGKENRSIVFGATPICISCGNNHSYSENISCCDDYDEDDYYYCDDCGERIHRDYAYWVGDYVYCSDCVRYCEECGEYVHQDNISEIDDVYVCDHCIEYSGNYHACINCGSIHYYDDMVETEDGNYYCDDCADDNTFYCEDCECYYDINETNIVYDEVTKKSYCKDCYDKIINERELHSEEEEMEPELVTA